ncbi:MAG: RNA polymerase sigma factor [Myxococcota bacterium]
MHSLKDVALPKSTVASFRSGDPTAFQAVARAHLRLVRGIVGRYFHRLFEQEEALQEVWLQILRQKETFDLERWDHLDRWISVVAKRRCIDLLRQEGRKPPADDFESCEVERQTSTPARQDRGVEEGELRAALDAFKSRLEPQWKDFFELHFVAGLSHPETARELDITVARSKYMKRVLVRRSRKNRALMEALGRGTSRSEQEGGRNAS